jgi:hypothetical protein
VTERKDRLEIESAKLDPEEQSMANESYAADVDLDETEGIYTQD